MYYYILTFKLTVDTKLRHYRNFYCPIEVSFTYDDLINKYVDKIFLEFIQKFTFEFDSINRKNHKAIYIEDYEINSYNSAYIIGSQTIMSANEIDKKYLEKIINKILNKLIFDEYTYENKIDDGWIDKGSIEIIYAELQEVTNYV